METHVCDCKKNQTHPEVLQAVAQGGSDFRSASGFGVFAVPAPEKGVLEYKVVIVENLTYLDCVKRGANCPAFKWVVKGFEWKLTNGSGQTVSVILDSKETLEKELNLHCAKPCIFNDCPPMCPCVMTCGGGCNPTMEVGSGTSSASIRRINDRYGDFDSTFSRGALMTPSDLQNQISRLPDLGGLLSPKSIDRGSQHSTYRVIPLVNLDNPGSLITPWLHVEVSWTYLVLYYRANAKAWVTDSKDGGNPISVASLTCSLFVYDGSPNAGDVP